MNHPYVAAGMCPKCVLGEVVMKLSTTLIPMAAVCLACGHTFDAIQEMKK